MVRIKVYKASQLAVILAAVILAAVTIAIVVSLLMSGDAAASAGKIMDILAAEEVTAAFSMLESGSGPIMPSFDDQTIPENEHTDPQAQEIIVEIISSIEDEIQPAAQPRVLIYHTHTHEAYAQVAEDPYVETEVFRTADPVHSIVRVGEALAALLEQYGFVVTHDMTDHEPPKLSTAYARSLATLESYEEPFDLYIDLHRDAYNSSLADCAYFGGQEVAQLMVLVGNGGEYEAKPDFEANLSFAQRLTDCINEKAPGVCREVMIKNGRYNQHVGTPAILIEVGHNENTLQQALSSMPVLADALKAALTGG